MINKDLKGKVYSTQEVRTGDIWIDGKPIYSKVIKGTSSVSTIDLNIANIDDLVKMEVLVSNYSDGGWRNVPWLFASNDTTIGSAEWAGGVYLSPSSNKLFLQLGKQLKNFRKIIVILEYTKTTD